MHHEESESRPNKGWKFGLKLPEHAKIPSKIKEGAKANTNRVEVEIEKNREEGNWSKVIELADQLKEKTPEFVCLCDFLIGEGKLVNYLEEYSPIEVYAKRARVSLVEAKRFLHQVTYDAGIKVCSFSLY
ncbi:hypothetical protein HHI36_023346 [Cryptolaemus montrouzieri]|uniref:Tetratricopeptide repeat protein 7 N-terminal domain-containing protein n=1 Tax=Cryptolaemus montrouzieri TaxID=559131 RepID=A0ABD2PG43_9CUCU